MTPQTGARPRAAGSGNDFEVFISYSRSSSEGLARDLEKGLERLAKPWYKLRTTRVFRDDSAMSASSGLWETIQSALHQSEWLLLLATPESASSEYVNKEITEWLTTKSAEKILLVHAGGTLEWDASLPGHAGTGDFSESSTAAPTALRSAYSTEPRWVNLAWHSEEGSLGTADPRFLDRLGDIAAPIRGVDKEQLISEDVRQHRRTRRLARGAVATLSTLLIISLIASFVALSQRTIAVEQRNVATEQSFVARSRLLAATAVDRSTTDLQSALLLAATAYSSLPNSQTVNSLYRVLNTSPQLAGFYDFGIPVTAVTSGPEAETIIAGTETGQVFSYDRSTDEKTELFDIGIPVTYLKTSTDGTTLVASGSQHEENGDETSASVLWRDEQITELPGTASAISPSGDTVILRPPVSYRKLDSTIWHLNKESEKVYIPDTFMTFTNEQTVIGIDAHGSVERVALDSKESERNAISMGLHMFGGAQSADGTRFTFIRGGEDIEVWDFDRPLESTDLEADRLIAKTGSSRAKAVALNTDGSRLATAAGGTIYVSDVVAQDEDPAVTELRGAGENANVLQFANNETLLSAAGSSVAVWNLDPYDPRLTSFDVTLYGDCNACPPAPTLVSPDGSKTVVNPGLGYGTIVNFDQTWSTLYSDIGNPDARRVYESKPTLTWLDNERLFAYSARSGRAWILTGDHMDEIVNEIPSHVVGRDGVVGKAFLRDDGMVTLLAEQKVLSIDPETGSSTLGSDPVNVMSQDGKYAAAFCIGADTTQCSEIKIYDTKTGDLVKTVHVDGILDNRFFIHDRGALVVALTTDMDNSGYFDDAELVRIDPATGDLQNIGHPGPSVNYFSGVSNDGYLYAEGAGEIVQVSLDDANRVSLLRVLSAPAAANGLGLSASGHLVIESEPTQRVIRLTVSPEAWREEACNLAGRDLTPDDLANLVDSTAELASSCGGEIPG